MELTTSIESSRPVITTAGLAGGPSRGEFSWEDYLVFGLSLALPLAIGIFFYVSHFIKGGGRCRRGHGTAADNDDPNSTEQFLLGNRSLNFAAVGLSALASVISGTFVVGLPAEIHYQGVAISYSPLGLALVAPVLTYIVIPKYHEMKFTSAYEYIENRFNRAARCVAAGLFIITMMFFLAVVLYVPALVFTQVTNLSLYLTIIITGGICTLYTAIGGMKAVVYTDSLQVVIMVIGLLVLCIVGAEKSGGGQKVWEVALRDGRINFNTSFSFDPRARITFWNTVIGGGVSLLCFQISNQMMVQRFMAVPNSDKAKGAVILAVVTTFLMYMLITFVGLVVHSTYSSCDPLIRKQIKSPDQIFVYFLMTVLGNHKGVPGLLVAAIFAAALSSVSSAINSLSAVFLEDVIGPAYEHLRKVKLSDRIKQRIAIVIVIVFGLITIGLSFAADKFTSKLSQQFATIWGALGGPLGGMFLLGFFFPFCNSLGAIIGCFGGLSFALWIVIGGFVYGSPSKSLPIGLCVGNMTAALPITPANATQPVLPPIAELYRISFQWFGLIGAGTTVIIGCLVSIATGGCKNEHTERLKKNLWFSCADKFCCCCPESCKRIFRCGGPNYEDDDEEGVNDYQHYSNKSNRDKVKVNSEFGTINRAFDDDIVLK